MTIVNVCLVLTATCVGVVICTPLKALKEASACSAGKLKCKNSSKCIKTNWICDGAKDCPEGEDEEDCNKCRNGRVPCSNGRCIKKSWICDGQKDCSDNGDESDCASMCTKNQFQCSGGKVRCIGRHSVCDGYIDCFNGTDEYCKGCPRNFFECKTVPGKPKKCIPRQYTCDEATDCEGGEDETDCKDGCPAGYFKCKYGNCIKDKYLCDTELDCSDKEDEDETMCARKTRLFSGSNEIKQSSKRGGYLEILKEIADNIKNRK